MAKHGKFKIGILVERSRAYGRRLCEGVAAFAHERQDWSLEFIDGETIRDPKRLRSYDGFIARVMDDETAKALTATERPVIDVFYAKPYRGFSVVEADHHRIGEIAAEHFLERKFTNFAYCGYDGAHSLARRNGFVRRLNREGMKCHEFSGGGYRFDNQSVISEAINRSAEDPNMKEWLRTLPKPIAVFCTHDYRAWQVLSACGELGIKVPREMAILGVDNDLLLCSFSSPMLSSIDPDSFSVGRTAADALQQQLKKRKDARSTIFKTVPPIGIVIRESTETYPLDPPWISDALLFISHHAHEGIRASDVNAHVGLSHPIVGKAFKETLGISVKQAIDAEQLSYAKRLLSETDLAMKDVAEKAGFSSPIHFSTKFKKAFKQTPASWREANRRR